MKLNQTQIRAIAYKVAHAREEAVKQKREAEAKTASFKKDVDMIVKTIERADTMLKTLPIKAMVHMNYGCHGTLREQVTQTLLEERHPGTRFNIYDVEQEILLATIDATDLASLASKLGVTL